MWDLFFFLENEKKKKSSNYREKAETNLFPLFIFIIWRIFVICWQRRAKLLTPDKETEELLKWPGAADKSQNYFPILTKGYKKRPEAAVRTLEEKDDKI